MPPPETKRASRGWRLAVLLALLAAVPLFYLSGLHRLLSWEHVRGHVVHLRQRADADPLPAFVLFFLAYVACTSLSLPSSFVLSLLAGAMFGFVAGTVLVSVASTAGACLAFLLSRYVLRDSVQRRFGPRLEAINRGVERDGAWYLLSLRLTPVVPYFLINFAMGLTPMPLGVYALVTWLGMLPVGMVIVNAGQALHGIRAPSDVLTPPVLASLALLALAPLLTRWLMKRWLPEASPPTEKQGGGA